MRKPAERVSLIGIPGRVCCVMLAAWVLAGCASVPTVRTIIVKVPVPVPCVVEEVPRPAWAMDALPAGIGLYETARAALMEIEQRRGYIERLEAVMRACS